MILVANLDCELVMARTVGQRSESLPLTAQRTASALGTLMRAFAKPGDRLWTLVPVDPERLPGLPGVPTVDLVTGPLPPGEDVLRWGETTELAAAVNERGFSLDLAREHGWALPGAGRFHSLFAIEQHLAAGGASAAPGGRWVLKLPLSAAGRSRVFGTGPVMSPDAQAGAQRLLNVQDSLIFEPWMERRADISATGWVTGAGPERIMTHGLRVDEVGRFRGLVIDPDARAPRKLEESVRIAGEALHAHGYRGPYGVDAWWGRDAGGREFLNPLGEINARMTFGHIARRLAESESARRVTLRIGKSRSGTGAGRRPALLPGSADATSAWLELG